MRALLVLLLLTNIAFSDTPSVNRVKVKHFSKINDGVRGNTQYIYHENESYQKTVSNKGDVDFYGVKMDKENMRDITVTSVYDNANLEIEGDQEESRLKRNEEESHVEVGTSEITDDRRVDNVVNYVRNVDVSLIRR